VNSPDHPSKGSALGDQYFLTAAVALLSAVYMFSPLTSYVGALLYLTLFSRRLSTRVRVATSVIAILSGASIWASRQVGLNVSDDFMWYYGVYSSVDTVDWTDRIPVYEVGLPLFFKILSLALPGLTPNGLMFVSTTVTGLILLFCVERFGVREFPREKRAYCVAMVFLFFSFVLTTQLTRQMLSSVLLVNVFFGLRAASRRLSLLLASAFHLSALAVYAILRTFQSRFLLLPFLLVSVVALAKVVDVQAAAPFITDQAPRVAYYLYLTSSDSGANWAALAIVLGVAVTGLMSLLILKAANAEVSSREKQTLALLVGVIIIYLLTLDVMLGPFRLFLVVHAVMAGWFFAYFTRRFPSVYLLLGGAGLIITRSLFLINPTSSFVPWDVYGPFSALPGYFMQSYLSR